MCVLSDMSADRLRSVTVQPDSQAANAKYPWSMSLLVSKTIPITMTVDMYRY